LIFLLALTLIGEGEVYYENEVNSAGEIFNRFNIKPLTIYAYYLYQGRPGHTERYLCHDRDWHDQYHPGKK